MGTNFYIGKKDGLHIGKRSAAGLYCWDCGETLCRTGISGVQWGTSAWYDKCPRCGSKPIGEDIKHSSGGRELGFNKDKPRCKKGVASCSSFGWAMTQSELIRNRRKRIVDEYGQKYTLQEFFDLLDECPIQSFRNVGREFC